MAQATKEVADLEKRASAYSGDDSEENRARMQQLKTDLESARADLEDEEYSHYVEEQEKLLSDLYDEYERVLMERLDNTDVLIADMIDRINANATSIEDTLNTVTDKVGYTMSETMHDIWDGEGSLGGIITTYGDNFLNSMTSLNEALGRIEAYVASMTQNADALASGTVESASSQMQTTPPPTPPTPPATQTQPEPQQPAQPSQPSTDEADKQKSDKGVKVKRGTWWIRSGPGMGYKRIGSAKAGDLLEYRGQKSGSWFAIVYKGKDAWISSQGSQLVGYSTGGIVGDPKKIAKRNGDNIVTINTLKKGEAVLTPDQTKLFTKFVSYLPQAQEAMNPQRFMAQAPDTSSNGGISIGDVSFNIPIDHVEDYDDLVTKMQKDTQFEKLIQSMTVDRLAGKSPLAKHKYKWG